VSGEARIRLNYVVKQFGTLTAVERLNLSVAPGEFVVLLGPSGCGKTTTLRMIAGLETPTSGRVTIDGRDVTRLPPGERDIAFVFQMFALYPHLTAEENIAFPLRAAALSSREIGERVERVIRRLNLEHLRRRRPRRLSGGDQQRVSLARAMVREPKAFLMDEPLGTLDADQRERTRQTIREIHNELRATTVFVTHDQLEAMALADRIAVMSAGKLLQYDTPQNVYDRPSDLFVANFIGSPGMNLVPATRYADAFVIAESNLRLKSSDNGSSLQRATFGIRPEFVRVDPSGAAAVAEHTELLGSHNLVEIRLGKSLIKARVASSQRFGEGETVRLRFHPSGHRWFDPESGAALAWQSTEVPHAGV
jgi:multiple sugar transport system ATP-binding protein